MATFERMLLARKHVIIAEKYNVIRKIGGGSFGDIFLAINIHDGEVNTWSKLQFSIDALPYITMSCQWWSHVFREFAVEDGGLGVDLIFYPSICLMLRDL